jgi:hypothetical protein
MVPHVGQQGSGSVREMRPDPGGDVKTRLDASPGAVGAAARPQPEGLVEA